MKLKKDKLEIEIFDTRAQMGEKAAQDAAAYIKEALKTKDELNIVFGAAPSQNDVLSSLLKTDVDFTRINAYHMDEYIGLSSDAPQRFGSYLNEHIFGLAPFKSVNYIIDEGKTPEQVCAEYSKMITDNPIDVVFMGIGENGHIAFNDPHVAFFNDKELVKIVELDLACRQQQVNDGCFPTLDDVPKCAYTLTVPALMSAKRAICVVPTKLKASAIRNTIMGEITEECPASIMRTREGATLYCDKDGASLLTDADIASLK